MNELTRVIKRLKTDTLFFKTMIAIALPLALQNMIQSGLNMMDTLMIGRLGSIEISAVAAANQIFFLMILSIFGICSGAQVFSSQYWGQKDIKGLRESLALSLYLSVGASLLFTVGTTLFPETLLSFYSNDPEVVRIGASYLRIVGISYPFTAITLAFGATLKSTEKVKLITVVSAISLLLNTLFNSFLIFGIGPFPQMGVEGAALATLIARLFECCFLIIFIYKKDYPSAIRFSEFFTIGKSFVQRYIKTSLPVILNELSWSLGITTISAVFGHMGTEALASFSITDTIFKLFTVFFFGTSNACAVMVGNRIGAKEEEKARYYAHSYTILGPLLGVVMGILLAISAIWLPLLFNVNPETRWGVTSILWVLALFLPIKIFNWHMIVGVFRSGGDTKYSLFVETLGIWGIAVPLAALTGLVFHLPLAFVYFALSTEELLKALFGLKRLQSGKWLHNVIEH